MTKLAAYMDASEPRVTQAEFGKRVGADQSTVSQWCRGDRRPGLGHALAIERETGGAVPAAYWTTIKTTAEAAKPRRARQRRAV